MHVRMEHVAEHEEPQAHAPYPGTDGYDNLPQFPAKFPLPFRRTIRRHELHQIVPLAETTIYEMEQRGAPARSSSNQYTPACKSATGQTMRCRGASRR